VIPESFIPYPESRFGIRREVQRSYFTLSPFGIPASWTTAQD
jgi:hypothetical protein